MYEGSLVRVTTVIGRPIGTITKGEFESGSLSPMLFWIRLRKDGILLKDVMMDEFDFLEDKEINKLKNKKLI